MERLPSQIVESFHQTGDNPFSLSVKGDRSAVFFVVNSLSDEVKEAVSEILLDKSLTSLEFEKLTGITFEIEERSILNLSYSQLSRLFYGEDVKGWFNVQFVTPTAFKSQGEYQYFPDLRMIFQSLMRKYNHFFESSDKIDFELLDEICKRTKIMGYRIHTQRFGVHNAYITGFQGNIVISCRGSQTIKNYVAMLLKFGEFTGVGVKTSLGMGAIQLKGESNGAKKG